VGRIIHEKLSKDKVSLQGQVLLARTSLTCTQGTSIKVRVTLEKTSKHCCSDSVTLAGIAALSRTESHSKEKARTES